MLLRPDELTPQIIEAVEKATLRFVVQALYDFRHEAVEIFREAQHLYRDRIADLGEDITREALDRIGTAQLPRRLLGRMDYKKARYIFHPDYALRQALFVDTKTEQERGSLTLQLSQTSLEVRFQGERHRGELPPIIRFDPAEWYLTTTIFVKYVYTGRRLEGRFTLEEIIVVVLPNGLLQDIYNPSDEDHIWRKGRHAPTRGEAFRIRVSLQRLRKKAPWRVQVIPLTLDKINQPLPWYEGI